MFAGEPGEAVAEHAADVSHQFGVAAENAIEEGEEARTVAARAGRGDLRDVVSGIVRSAPSGSQIDYAIWRIEQPRVRVPLVDGRGQARSARARRSTAATVLALAIAEAILGLLQPAATSRQIRRARSNA